MFKTKAVMFEWPFPGDMQGREVRFFHPVGPFHAAVWGDTWVVKDERVANHRGGPDVGVTFTTRQQAEQHIVHAMKMEA